MVVIWFLCHRMKEDGFRGWGCINCELRKKQFLSSLLMLLPGKLQPDWQLKLTSRFRFMKQVSLCCYNICFRILKQLQLRNSFCCVSARLNPKSTIFLLVLHNSKYRICLLTSSGRLRMDSYSLQREDHMTDRWLHLDLFSGTVT